MNMNKTVKKKVNVMNSSQNEELSPSRIVLSFDRVGSISLHGLRPGYTTSSEGLPVVGLSSDLVLNWIFPSKIILEMCRLFICVQILVKQLNTTTTLILIRIFYSASTPSYVSLHQLVCGVL
jgi:hypothetical protein